MRRSQIDSNTMRSSGVKIAGTHMYDWLILILLVVAGALLHLVSPFYRFVGKDMMTNLKCPLKRNTVPFLGCSGLLHSVSLTLVTTNAMKLALGWPWPELFWCCFADGKDVYDKSGNIICHSERSVIEEGHEISKQEYFMHITKLCIIFLPHLLASLVGISRVGDYWHRWQDIFAGGFLGVIVAIFSYLQFFPPLYHAQGWGPHAYFEEMTSCTSAEAANTVGLPNSQALETPRERCLDERGNTDCIGLSLSPFSGRSPQDMESGER